MLLSLWAYRTLQWPIMYTNTHTHTLRQELGAGLSHGHRHNHWDTRSVKHYNVSALGQGSDCESEERAAALRGCASTARGSGVRGWGFRGSGYGVRGSTYRPRFVKDRTTKAITHTLRAQAPLRCGRRLKREWASERRAANFELRVWLTEVVVHLGKNLNTFTMERISMKQGFSQFY